MKTKIWVIIAISLIIIGIIIFATVMSIYNWEFTKLSTVKYEKNTYEVDKQFNNITINTDTDDIVFVRSEDNKCKVECNEPENAKHYVEVKDGELSIGFMFNERNWYEYIGISFGTSKITVYLPEGEYNNLTIKESTGDILIPKDFEFSNIDIFCSTGNVENYASAKGNIKIKASTGSITLSDISCDGDIIVNVTTGKTNLNNIKCKNLFSDGDTGNLYLNNVVAKDKFDFERSTGDVRFVSCDANDINVETDTGSVKGSLLSEKVFITETDTGSINVPKTLSGGKCEISTDTGDIKITIE